MQTLTEQFYKDVKKYGVLTTSCVAVITEGRILLLKRQLKLPKELNNTWCLPGGYIEKGESPIDAASRELFEETRILVRASELQLASVRHWQFSDFFNICFTYTLTLKGGIPVVTLNEENSERGWFLKAEVPVDLIHPMITGQLIDAMVSSEE